MPHRAAARERPQDRYRWLLQLDQGGMAEVHIALARRSGRAGQLVVLKQLRPSFSSKEEYREMFRHEARLAVRLEHPNIVRTYEIFEDVEGPVIAMEYLEGQPLARVLRAVRDGGRTLSPAASVRVVRDVLAALHHAHELCDPDGTPLDIVHRDVSPQNVFITYRGDVKLLDFGIAKANGATTRTQPGWMKGKFGYMAPEQFHVGATLESGAPSLRLEARPREALDRRVDVFTAGVVLWEMVTGRPLFWGLSDAETISALLHAPIPRASTLVGGVDPGLDAVLARALERDPARRFPSAAAMADALGAVLERLPAPRHDLGTVVSRLFEQERVALERHIGEELGESSTLARATPVVRTPPPARAPLIVPRAPERRTRRASALRIACGVAFVLLTMLATRWTILAMRATDADAPSATTTASVVPREATFARERR